MRNNLKINEKGNLVHGGCDVVDLAKEYGTPLYVMDEQDIRRRCKLVKDNFMNKYDNTLALFASKAISNLAIYKIIKEEGIGLDVVSGGELYTAIKAGFPMENIYFHGNNKTRSEIEMGIENNIGCFVIDNDSEIESVQEIAEAKGKTVKAMFRISPGVSGYTHDYISTGQIDSKFGFAIHANMVENAVEKILQCKNINFVGIHCHLGSLIFQTEAYKKSAKLMVNLVKTIQDKFNIEIKELNLGGGFGVYDMEQEKCTDISDFIDDMMKVVDEECANQGIKRPKILVEPGRWIVTEAGVTLYTVGSVKEITGIKKYVSIDGGLTDNPRPALYQAVYQAVIANKASEKPAEEVTIAGRCCETGDILIQKLCIPEAEPGDILAVFSTGAYNYSMASNYNRLPKPAMVMVDDGNARVVVKRETYEDIIRNDLF